MYNLQWLLASRPEGLARPENFEIREVAVPTPAQGEVLVRNIYLMMTPSMRLWMDDNGDEEFPTQPLGEVMAGMTLGIVEKSESAALEVGTYVNGLGGWQHYYTAPADQLTPVHPAPGVPLGAYRTVLDFQGLTAYCGLVDIIRPVAGETMVVTAAAGSLGSLVVQIGKKQGMRVIGIAGGPEKCAWLVEELGADGAIDYKNSDVDERLIELCPDGVDALFENVGGPIMFSVVNRLNTRARVVLSGLVSGYFGPGHPMPFETMMELLKRRIRMEGLGVQDYLARYTESREFLEPWVKDGSLKYRLDIIDGGLESATVAMARLARGENQGMQLIKVTPDA